MIELTSSPSSQFSIAVRETNGLVRIGERFHRVVELADHLIVLHPLTDDGFPDSDDDFDAGIAEIGDPIRLDGFTYTITARDGNTPILIPAEN